MNMQTKSFLGFSGREFHRVVYYEWGAQDNPRVALCAHGLTRNGRDFDYLAKAISDDFRVIAIDVAGRGKSDWLLLKDDYGYPMYCHELAALMAHLDIQEADWIGTSMGGLIGMMLAAAPRSPIRKLVLNDIGPFITSESLQRVADYVGNDPHFATLDEVEAYIREVNAPFGNLTDEQWKHHAQHYSRRLENGEYALAYDPAIAAPLKTGEPLEEVDLWPIYDAVRCPTMVIRGMDSDILLHETALEMTQRGPLAKLLEIPGAGHAPALMDEEQIESIRGWLLGKPD